ncbi:MAG: transglutaminase family protein [Gammaproteobacteria bacterium]
MRRIRIFHVSRYQYTQPVSLLTQKLHLRPREGYDIRIESSRLDIFPDFSVQWQRDIYGNCVGLADFYRDSQTMQITSEVVVQHYHDPSMHFNVAESAYLYPFNYEPAEQTDLFPYLAAIFPQDAYALRSWLEVIYRPGNVIATTDLLDLLNQKIAREFAYMVRIGGGVQSPVETLQAGAGSCRDVAMLFIEACRALGLAGRFVSGYLLHEVGGGQFQSTHAWSEVYLPGAGWRGYDSTSGLRVGGNHIAVAQHRHPEAIPPISGAYLGPPQWPDISEEVSVQLL